MGVNAVVKGASATEKTYLSVLDLVVHSVRTVAKVLSPQDTLSIVTYATEEKVVCTRVVMDDAGKRKVELITKTLEANGQTNLWGGLHAGLKILGAPTPGRQGQLMLLTDGVANVEPPRGTFQMLRRVRGTGDGLRATVHTFAFGCELETELLRKISEETGGTYAFIADSGLVGTVFVNSISNILVTMAHQSRVTYRLEVQGKPPSETVVEGGPLLYGQRRLYLVDWPKGAVGTLTAAVSYRSVNSKRLSPAGFRSQDRGLQPAQCMTATRRT
eukprot:TRINITY_DN6416_c0_g1_i1.p2 TRINITY_DN6416_c0_g1~~TRINITY_DN6416_c0_g1_i1.p2  ORF type:complete len:273 (+),score=66.62 TRINITY_DN6416_c0_g1_i1:484-1302(+)